MMFAKAALFAAGLLGSVSAQPGGPGGMPQFGAEQVAAFSAAKEQFNVNIIRTATTAVFADGGVDPEAATAAVETYFSPDYIQHNPQAPNGLDFFQNFIGDARPATFFSEIGAYIAEGDYVVTHSRFGAFFPGDSNSIAIDFLRVRDGIIIEHWDVLAPEIDANETASGNAMYPIENPPENSGPNEESNRAAVSQLLHRIYNFADVAAVEQLYAADVVNHDIVTANGRDAIAARLDGVAPGDFDYRLGAVVAYGDFVAVHAKLVANGESTIQAEIFRLADGVITEAWSVSQPETQPLDSLTGNTMFPIY